MGKSDLPHLVPYDNKIIYKELAKEFCVSVAVVEHLIKTDYKQLRKFINTHKTKGEAFNCKNLGKFRCSKSEDTDDRRNIKLKIEAIINRYINIHINEEDVANLKVWREQGYYIPYYHDIIIIGRRRIRFQLIDPIIRPHLPDDYFIKNGAVWTKPIEYPPMDPKDSVMEKFKDQDYLDQLEF